MCVYKVVKKMFLQVDSGVPLVKEKRNKNQPD